MRRLAKIATLCSLVGAFALADAGDAVARSASVSFIGITNGGIKSPAEQFAPGDTATIIVVVTWQTIVGRHHQRVELISPDGSIYQKFTSVVSSSSGQAVVKTPVRVAGTWMTEYQMYGEWTVKVYLNGTRQPITKGSFTLSD